MIRFTPGGAVGPESPPASRIKTSLLACLSEGSDSEEAEMEKKKTLKLQFILQRKRDGHVLERFLRGKHDEVRSEMNGVLSLAKAVKKRRNVEVELELKEIAKITDTIDLLKLDLDTSSRWGKRRNG